MFNTHFLVHPKKQTVSCRASFKPSQDSLRQDEYERQPAWMAWFISWPCRLCTRMPQLTPECLRQQNRASQTGEGQLLLLMKYFHFPHMLMLWEFAFGVIIHCLILTVCVTLVCWPCILCGFLSFFFWGGGAVGGTSQNNLPKHWSC